MPHLPAAILIMLDRPHPDKQEAIALAAAAAERLRVVARCSHWGDCLSLILSSAIVAVVCAVDPGHEAREAYELAGARLVVARDEQVRIRRDVNQLVARLYLRGDTTQEIAQLLEVTLSEIRRSLARAGVHRRSE